MSDSSTDAVEAQVETTDVNTAQSSNAETQGAEPSLLDTVHAALKKGAEEKSPVSEEGQAAEAEPAPEAEAKADAEEDLTNPTEQDLKGLGQKTQRRIKAFLEERSSLRQTLEAIEPKAKAYDQMYQFAEQNGLAKEDVNSVFEIAALIKKDPQSALQRVATIYQQLATITGDILPADIQERVQLGYLNEADAKELVRARNEAARQRAEREALEAQAAKEREFTQTKTAVDFTASVTNEWETQQKQRDPDWNMKRPHVERLLKLHVLENGFPKDRAEVVRTLDSILGTVTEDFRALRPKPQAVRPVVGAASSGARPEPDNVYDFVNMKLGAR